MRRSSSRRPPIQAESNVPAIQAQLDDALFNLEQCKMRAPTNGYVVNWLVQPGTMLSPVTAAAAGTFVDTSDVALVAVFPQNYLTYVQQGDLVEIVLDPYPGYFHATARQRHRRHRWRPVRAQRDHSQRGEHRIDGLYA